MSGRGRKACSADRQPVVRLVSGGGDMCQPEKISAAWAALTSHELGPAFGMTEHCICGWGWSSRPVIGGYDTGCWVHEEAVEILIEAGLI